jgi:hypothetical protein
MSLNINIINPKKFTSHRSGWSYAISNLESIKNSKGILFDDFLDITFGYNRIKNIENKVIPYKKPWIGVLHHPPKICPWYSETYKYNIDINNFLNSTEFLISLEKCEGIIVLSNYLKKYLKNNFSQFKNIPIAVIKHPTESGELLWDFKKFKKGSALYGMKILSIGYFLRNMTSIYLLKANKKLDKYLMPSDIRYGLNNLSLELEHKKLSYIDKNSIKILNWQQNSFYDKLLEQSIVFLDFYDTSCNNAIIESIIRTTPVVVNKHEAVQEYLGEDYPLYFENLQDTRNLLNYDSIYSAHEYFVKNKTKFEYLNGEYFLQDFIDQVSGMVGGQKIKSSKKLISNKNLSIITQPTEFGHRHGWKYVTENLYKRYKNENNLSNNTKNKIYCVNFLEHTFKNEEPKLVSIENKKHFVSRGYNLFSVLGTEAVKIDNKYYIWKDNSWKPHNNDLTRLCETHNFGNLKNSQWFGIAHNPVIMPYWFDYSQNINSIINNENFTRCAQNCKTIITLSKCLKQDLHNIFKKHDELKHIKLHNLIHPMPKRKKIFSYKKYIENPKIIQIGYWLRKMHSFWDLKTKQKKIWLYGDKFASKMFNNERVFEGYTNLVRRDENLIFDAINSSKNVEVDNVSISWLSNNEYDNTLNNSVVFLDLYQSSANNAVLECMASATPMIINRLESSEEYLGKNYPLFFNSIEEASDLCSNNDAILAAHHYLLDRYQEEKMSIDYFMTSIESILKS